MNKLVHALCKIVGVKSNDLSETMLKVIKSAVRRSLAVVTARRIDWIIKVEFA